MSKPNWILDADKEVDTFFGLFANKNLRGYMLEAMEKRFGISGVETIVALERQESAPAVTETAEYLEAVQLQALIDSARKSADVHLNAVSNELKETIAAMKRPVFTYNPDIDHA